MLNQLQRPNPVNILTDGPAYTLTHTLPPPHPYSAAPCSIVGSAACSSDGRGGHMLVCCAGFIRPLVPFFPSCQQCWHCNAPDLRRLLVRRVRAACRQGHLRPFCSRRVSHPNPNGRRAAVPLLSRATLWVRMSVSTSFLIKPEPHIYFLSLTYTLFSLRNASVCMFRSIYGCCCSTSGVRCTHVFCADKLIRHGRFNVHTSCV